MRLVAGGWGADGREADGADGDRGDEGRRRGRGHGHGVVVMEMVVTVTVMVVVVMMVEKSGMGWCIGVLSLEYCTRYLSGHCQSVSAHSSCISSLTSQQCIPCAVGKDP